MIHIICVYVNCGVFFHAEFGPEFDPVDINRLPACQAYIRLMVYGTTAAPFSFVTLPPPKSDRSFREDIIAWSRKQYARPRKEVERGILRNWE